MRSGVWEVAPGRARPYCRNAPGSGTAPAAVTAPGRARAAVDRPPAGAQLREFAAQVAVQTTGTVIGGLILHVWLGPQ
ncbi:hypothetical protein TU94_28970 [Streptomyces cyaneogriseus subsp. noncyanogenus]|uniref:Uncharacterized protein n=1 Tax=Streptomyces cyaneogriseus subsp. noncyanogenus TaxID=477245 RepID=A0A0C5G7X8_9ACTN|nr:hypothetical protein [Streptomyces cyaneogriseus]AJP04880.1 hypothetical protein TU94_28970 [Streptomyces cyaneogriseus subsp. noncyanogenus]